MVRAKKSSKESAKSNILDKDIQKRQWIKVVFFGLITLAIIIFLGYFYSGNRQTNKLMDVMGKEKMSSTEKQSIVTTTGVIDAQNWVTDHGVRVYYVHAPNLPMVDIQLTFDAGSARDGDKKGLAYLTNELLSEGTKNISADQVAETFESSGVQYSSAVQRDMAVVHIRSLTDVELLTPAVKLLADILKGPAFPEKGFLRERSSALKLLDYQMQKPNKVAEKAFYAAIYADQPYSNWPAGTKEGLSRINPDDLKAFHQQYYVAKNVVITIVGAVDLEGANAIAEAITDGLPEGEKAPQLPKASPLQERKVEKIAFPSGQTHIMMGAPSITRDDPDFYNLYVGNHILGGSGMVSRLFEEIRNKRGFAYDVRSYFIPMRIEGPFIIGCQTKKESSQESLKLMENVVKNFVEKGPTAQELEDAKMNLLGGFPLRFDSNASITNAVSVLGFYDLPIDYYDQYRRGIEFVTLASIQDAYKRRIQPDNMAVVLVGML